MWPGRPLMRLHLNDNCPTSIFKQADQIKRHRDSLMHTQTASSRTTSYGHTFLQICADMSCLNYTVAPVLLIRANKSKSKAGCMSLPVHMGTVLAPVISKSCKRACQSLWLAVILFASTSKFYNTGGLEMQEDSFNPLQKLSSHFFARQQKSLRLI